MSSARAQEASETASAKASESRDVRALKARTQGRVLFVADDVDGFSRYAAMLEEAGFAVAGCAGGIRARVMFRETRPHVVIINADLRGVSDTELARMLLATDETVLLIFVGKAEASPARRQEALAAGAFDYFSLPAEVALLVSRIGQLVAISHRIEALRSVADRDHLTGLANRRRFRAALGKEVERWRRYKAPCALLLVDIDFLKRINDAHGHSAGDTAIRRVALHLNEFSRDNDTPARLGGEEFALLLAGASEAHAVTVAERIRQAVSATPIEDIGAITISLGVAACPSHAVTERLLYAASDAALYRAKRTGRNRAELAPPLH